MNIPTNPAPDQENSQPSLKLHLPGATSEQSSPVIPQNQAQGSGKEPPVFYIREEEEEERDEFAAPYQVSSAMPAAQTGHLQTGQAAVGGQTSAPAPPKPPKARSFPLGRVLILLVVVVLVVLVGAMVVAAQTTPAMQMPQANHTTTQPGKTPMPTKMPMTPTGTTWQPQQVPTGWTAAGLGTGDALDALRTAATFTDREMSIDFRSVGTRTIHSGTMTAAVFLLTPAAQLRFGQNDIRVINQVFFDQVQQEKLVQGVVSTLPQLTNFATQGKQQFAWVDVTFSLWQSKVVNGQPSDNFEMDPATNQPKIHHITVLLLRVPQTANAPLGGTGWLVSAYALDLPTGQTLTVVQPA